MINFIKAFIIAIKAHRGQKDKAGKPYIFHLVRVAVNSKGLEAKTVAILHDVIEDSSYELEDLDFLNIRQKDALKLLTHNKCDSYEDYIRAIKNNPLARKVKLADLEDNMDLSRLEHIGPKDWQRYEKYKKASSYLKN